LGMRSFLYTVCNGQSYVIFFILSRGKFNKDKGRCRRVANGFPSGIYNKDIVTLHNI
jgi:hypothetical protein